MKTLFNYLWQTLRSVRPRQWLKNAVLFAPILFSGELFEANDFYQVFLGFIIFCLASSAAYLFNDVIDAPKDRGHPFKKLRPIAAGRLPVFWALSSSAGLATLSLYLSYLYLNRYFFLTLVLFALLQIFYSLFLRNVIIFDALSVSLTFILRVFAGSFAAQASISSWLILATIGVALLLSFGKRRSERTLLVPNTGAIGQPTRTTLFHYPDTLLDSMISVSASFTLISYSLFSFQISPRHPSKLFSALLPPTLFAPKWMMLTIPFVIYGVARYLYVIYEKKEGESPERALLSDKPLMLTLTAWFLTTVIVIYFLGT